MKYKSAMKKDPNELKGTSIRLPQGLLERVDRWAKRRGVTKRSDAIRMLITEALENDDAPRWLARLDELASKANTSREEFLDFLISEHEPETPQPSPKKPKRRGIIAKAARIVRG